MDFSFFLNRDPSSAYIGPRDYRKINKEKDVPIAPPPPCIAWADDPVTDAMGGSQEWSVPNGR